MVIKMSLIGFSRSTRAQLSQDFFFSLSSSWETNINSINSLWDDQFFELLLRRKDADTDFEGICMKAYFFFM